MQVGKWGNSLAVRLPAAVVEILGLKEGDEIEIEVAGDRTLRVGRDPKREEALARLRALAWKLPPGFKFSRDERTSAAARTSEGRRLLRHQPAGLRRVAARYALRTGARPARQGGAISVQVLNEFANVARHKLRKPWPEVAEALDGIRALCAPPLPITLATHEAALGIAARLGYRFYDSLIVASALEAGCATLYSEDMRDGQVVEGASSPFANPFGP
jgi:predicted nucleic acid-binding protein/bifunctional DNA-binding transcriptional regulator/antitoxin component of YhaV-PrlF toxin-antitoxin module